MIKKGCFDHGAPGCEWGNYHCCVYDHYNCEGTLIGYYNMGTGGDGCGMCEDYWGNVYTCNFGIYCDGRPQFYDTRDWFNQNLSSQGGCCPEVLSVGYEPKPTIPEETKPDPNEPEYDPASVADPISIYDGNTTESEEDFRFASPNRRGFFFKRLYNSEPNWNRRLGYGWSHTYSVYLHPSYEFEGTVYLRILDETGRGVYFEEAASGHYPLYGRLQGANHRGGGRRKLCLVSARRQPLCFQCPGEIDLDRR